jgi:hypothetical protein
MTEKRSEKRERDDSSTPDDAAELRERVGQLERENRRLRERCEQAELEIVRLERSVKGVESTLSFRLGHALIQSTKSLNGLRALPLVLSELRRDNRRRKLGDEERSLIGAALRVSAGYAKRGGKQARGAAASAPADKKKPGDP